MKLKAPAWGILALASLVAALACFGVARDRALQARAPIDAGRMIAGFHFIARPLLTLDMNLEFSDERRQQLIDPDSLLPRSFDFDVEELGTLHRYEQLCGNPPPLPKDPELRKAHEWALFECGHQPRLPEGFFARRPWMHPLGGSYVGKALESRRREESGVSPRDLVWAHALELGSSGFYLPPTQAVLAELTPVGLKALLRGENVEGSSFVLLRNFSLGDRVYRSFLKDDWERYLKAARVRARACGAGDLPQEGFCWESLSPGPLVRFLAVGGILLLMVSGFASAYALREGKRRRKQIERQRFAFLMLAHELRTPVSALALELETLREQEAQLPEREQSALLRAFDATERLRRLSELSRRYLDASSPGLLSMTPQTIPSLHEFLTEEARSAPGEVTLEFEAPDAPFRTDAGWLSFCLRNLLNNAFAHGKPPVRLSLRAAPSSGGWELRLSDEGIVKKSAKSQGLGLGLSLVERVSRELGFEFTRSEGPTCFTLRLKEART